MIEKSWLQLLAEIQVPLGKEFEQVLYDNLWDLMTKQPPTQEECTEDDLRREVGRIC